MRLACKVIRQEGWGFGMIEAMQLGKPVICTAYPGNMEFCNDDTSYLVDFETIAPTEKEYIFVERGSLWADPNTSTAAEHMRTVARDLPAAMGKGARAKTHIGENFSTAAIARRYGARLTAIREDLNRDLHS